MGYWWRSRRYCWPVWRQNIESMVGRCAAPRAVERKPAGRSDYMNACSVKKTGKMGKRNAPLIHTRIDPPVRNPSQSFVKGLQLKCAGINMMSELLPYICALMSITRDMILHEYGRSDEHREARTSVRESVPGQQYSDPSSPQGTPRRFAHREQSCPHL